MTIHLHRTGGPGRLRSPAVLLAAFVAGTVPAAADLALPLNPGAGGGLRERPCPEGRFLTGIHAVVGDDVIGVAALCARADNPADVRATEYMGGKDHSNYARHDYLRCPPDRPFVADLAVIREGAETVVVNDIYIWCQKPGDVTPAYIAADSDSADAATHGWNVCLTGGIFGRRCRPDARTESHCPPGTVGSGLRGKSGVWLDDLALFCREIPRITFETPLSDLPIQEQLGTVTGPKEPALVPLGQLPDLHHQLGTVTGPQEPYVPPPGNGVKARIARGERFRIVFTVSRDPCHPRLQPADAYNSMLGTIAATNGVYAIEMTPQSGGQFRWTATGPQQAGCQQHTAAYTTGDDPRQGRVNVWGLSFAIDDAGAVYDNDDGADPIHDVGRGTPPFSAQRRVGRIEFY